METEDQGRRDSFGPAEVRNDDIQPYVPLVHVSRLFRFASKVVLVALFLEVIARLVAQGTGAILPVLAETIRGIILAAILWGAADLTVLLVGIGGDARASRVLLGRISARSGKPQGGRQRSTP